MLQNEEQPLLTSLPYRSSDYQSPIATHRQAFSSSRSTRSEQTTHSKEDAESIISAITSASCHTDATVASHVSVVAAEGFGDKTIGFWGGYCLLLNNICGM